MPSVAAGVSELRVKGEDGAFRVFYFAATSKGILVFHAFGRRRSGRLRWKSSWPKSVSRSCSMLKVKPVVAKTPKALAEALDLPAADAREWQVQHELAARLKEIARKQKYTHAQIATRSGTSRTRVTAILNGDLESLGYKVRVSVVKSAA
jgi:hypothetical protein